jgi:hypothetical protein
VAGHAEYGDLWALDLDTLRWTQLAAEPEPLQLCQEKPPSGPEPRHSACMWCWGNSLFVFGGATKRQGAECTFGDLWRFCLQRRCWSSVPLRGTPLLLLEASYLLPPLMLSHRRSCMHDGRHAEFCDLDAAISLRNESTLFEACGRQVACF